METEGNRISRQAWDDFSEWCDQWLKDHPEDQDLGVDTLAMMYPDGKLEYDDRMEG